MKMLAMCTSTEPNTCLDTSKYQIFSGRCGRSLYRLYTRASRARAPRAAWTSSAKDPRSWHSPSSPPWSGASGAAVGLVVAVAVAARALEETALRMVAMPAGTSTPTNCGGWSIWRSAAVGGELHQGSSIVSRLRENPRTSTSWCGRRGGGTRTQACIVCLSAQLRCTQ